MMSLHVSQRWLLPLLKGGPNNEITGLKEVLVLGKLLGQYGSGWHTHRHTYRHIQRHTHANTHTHMHTQRHTQRHTHMQTHIYSHMHVHTCTHKHITIAALKQAYISCAHTRMVVLGKLLGQ